MTAQLAAREHQNLIAATELVTSNAPDRLLRHEGGVAVIISGAPILIFNQIFIETDEASPDSVASAVEAARASGVLFVLNLRVGADDRFFDVARTAGLVELSETPWLPGMALEPIPDEVPAPAGLEIIKLARAEQVEDFLAVTVAGFDMPEEMVRALLAPDFIRLPGVTAYTGYADGRPVSTGVGVQTGATIGLYNIATIPEARGRGFGAAITGRVAADGRQAGCDVATLQASDMGFPVYERMGYRTVVEYMGFVPPGPDSA